MHPHSNPNLKNLPQLLFWFSFVFGIIIFAPLVNAQPNDVDSPYVDTLFCPIESSVSAAFNNVDTRVLEVEEIFSSEIIISNKSSYTMGGIMVGVGVYPDNVSSGEPTHWVVVPDTYQLQGGKSTVVPFEVEVTTIPPGPYVIRVVAVQGDESVILGALFRNEIRSTDTINIKKVGAQQSHASLQVAVGDVSLTNTVTEVVAGRVDIKVTTENNRSVPIVDSRTLLVLSEGDIPLGTAVRAEKAQLLTLIPGSSQNIFLRNALLRSGEYTVLGAVLTEGVLQPIIKRTLSLPGENSGRWQYLSKVGLSEYPLQADSVIIACISPIETSETETPYRFSELFGFSFSLKTKEGLDRNQIIYTDNVTTYDYVAFLPNLRSHNLRLETGILQDRFEGTRYVTEDNISNREEILKDSLVTVTTVSQQLVCVDEEICGGTIIEASPQPVTEDSPSPWFYGAIILAATLLGYLMLRRLSPKEEQIKIQKLHKDELQ